MLDLSLMPEHYLRKVREWVGVAPDDSSLDNAIAQMTPEELVRMWCWAVGLPGYANHIIGLVAAAYSAGQAREQLWKHGRVLPREGRTSEIEGDYPSTKDHLPAHKLHV
jgi:hypothetical protein